MTQFIMVQHTIIVTSVAVDMTWSTSPEKVFVTPQNFSSVVMAKRPRSVKYTSVYQKPKRSEPAKRIMQWNVHQKPATNLIRNELIQIGDSIWYSTDHHTGEKGMVEYCLTTNQTKQIIKYSHSINPQYHSVCSYKDSIYIICTDHRNTGQIIEFYPASKKYSVLISFSC